MAILSSEIRTLQGGATSLRLEISAGTKIKVQRFSLRAYSSTVVHYVEKTSMTEKNKRKMIGETVTYDILEAKEDGWIIVSGNSPCGIIESDAEELFAATRSFLCSEEELNVEPYAVKNIKIRDNCEGGMNWQHYQNPEKRKFYLEFETGVIEILVQPGESVMVFHGYWKAMEGGLSITPIDDDIQVTNTTTYAKKLYIRAYKNHCSD